jgi:hypothetical protein
MNSCVIKKRARATLISIIMITTTLFAASGHAATVSYIIDQSNDLPDGTDYLQITISDSVSVAGDIDMVVQVIHESLPEPGGNFGLQSFYFNADDSLEIAAENVRIGDGDWNVRENRNAGGSFGKFDFGLSGHGSSRVETLTLSISGVDGDTINSYAIGSALNPSSGEFFAAHVAGFSKGPYGVSSGKFAGSTPIAPVPVPPAALLLGSAFVLLSRFRRNQATRNQGGN